MNLNEFIVEIAFSAERYEIVLPIEISVSPGEIITEIANLNNKEQYGIFKDLSVLSGNEQILNLLNEHFSLATTQFIMADIYNEFNKDKPIGKYAERISMLSNVADSALLGCYSAPLFAFQEKISMLPKINIYREKTDYIYTIKNLASILVLDIDKVLSENLYIRNCKNCGKWFIAPTNSNAMYCNNPSPQDDKKTCKKFCKNSIHTLKRKNNEALHLYNLLLSAMINQSKRNPNMEWYKTRLEQFKTESKIWRKQVKTGEKTELEYFEWLQSVKNNK